MNNHKMIQKRAEILHEILDGEINRGSRFIPQDYYDAFKATYALKERSIGRYKKAFKQSGLDFDIPSVEVAYEDFGEQLPGIIGLMVDERAALKELKRRLEAEDYKRKVISL